MKNRNSEHIPKEHHFARADPNIEYFLFLIVGNAESYMQIDLFPLISFRRT
jgi:hypothetical protein